MSTNAVLWQIAWYILCKPRTVCNTNKHVKRSVTEYKKHYLPVPQQETT